MRRYSLRAVVAIVVAVLSFSLEAVTARAGWDGTPLSRSSALPAPFSFATASDALAATYPSYVRSLGIARALRTTDGDAAHLSILEARPWYAGGRPYLVVAIARQTDDQAARTDLCGGCWERFAIAVLAKRDGSRLRLVARTHDDGPTEADPVPGEVDADLSVKGDGVASLDLAPYHLSNRETLIGVRNTVSITGGNFGTRLALFRIVGDDLKAVANIRAGDVTYQPTRTMSNATIVVAGKSGTYNELHVLTRHYDDIPTGLDYSLEPAPGSKPVASEVSTFRFDGTRFHEIVGAQR
jgi:hypothetical protein